MKLIARIGTDHLRTTAPFRRICKIRVPFRHNPRLRSLQCPCPQQLRRLPTLIGHVRHRQSQRFGHSSRPLPTASHRSSRLPTAVCVGRASRYPQSARVRQNGLDCVGYRASHNPRRCIPTCRGNAGTSAARIRNPAPAFAPLATATSLP